MIDQTHDTVELPQQAARDIIAFTPPETVLYLYMSPAEITVALRGREPEDITGKPLIFTYRGDPIASAMIEEYRPAEHDDENPCFIIDTNSRERVTRSATGFSAHRLTSKHGGVERSFAKIWRKINTPTPGLHGGQGILQALLDADCGLLSEREHRIVATVIQWLGSAIGSGFLDEVNNESGDQVRAYLRFPRSNDPNPPVSGPDPALELLDSLLTDLEKLSRHTAPAPAPLIASLATIYREHLGFLINPKRHP